MPGPENAVMTQDQRRKASPGGAPHKPPEIGPCTRVEHWPNGAMLEQDRSSGFVMEIESILSVEEEIEIRTFQVETVQGTRTIQTERDEWPRELEGGGLLIRDVAGDLYAVRDASQLDDTSLKLLWVFLD